MRGKSPKGGVARGHLSTGIKGWPQERQPGGLLSHETRNTYRSQGPNLEWFFFSVDQSRKSLNIVGWR